MKRKYVKSAFMVFIWAMLGVSVSFSQQIAVYTMEGCGRCASTIDYFKNNGVKYTEYPTSDDTNNSKMWELLWGAGLGNGESVSMPVVVVDGKVNYNIPNLTTFLNQFGKGKQNTNNNNNSNTGNSGKVEVYTMKGCGRCSYAVKYLKDNNIKYMEYPTANATYNSKMWELVQASGNYEGGSITMPVIVYNGKVSFNMADMQSFMPTLVASGSKPANNSNTNTKKTGCISGNCVTGNGVYVWENGDKYTGAFVNSSLEGKGKYIWSMGATYDGDWSGNVQNGYGTYIDQNGNKSQGNWVNGKITSSYTPSSDNNNVVPGGSSNTGSSGNLTKAQKDEFIKKHNQYRNEVGSAPIQWSDELAQYAQAWGEHLASIGCDMQHRPRTGEWAQKYGENLYWCSGRVATPSNAVDSWGDEKKIYDKKPISNSNMAAGHYTQIIWYKTTQVGCAIVKCEGNQYLVVCNYSPAGNYIGQSPYKK